MVCNGKATFYGMVIDTLLFLFMHVGDSKTCAENAYHTGPCNSCGRMARNRQMRPIGPKAGGSP
ncbi:hypothetical protein CsSME_00018849 [Camellia sinensis var. sinensis]